MKALFATLALCVVMLVGCGGTYTPARPKVQLSAVCDDCCCPNNCKCDPCKCCKKGKAK